MNQNVKRLYQIAQKKSRNIIGLMSGTSLDGLDVALCNISGHGNNTTVKVEKFITWPYARGYREKLLEIISKKNVDLENLCLLHELTGLLHGDIINKCLKKWKTDALHVDLIASHGQTIYHAPRHLHKQKDLPNATLQIGDADHIAVQTGIITLSDFRQKHIAAGGEGAPLAAYGDLLLFKESDRDVFLLNIGGIANFTFIPAKGNVLSTDTGPGNTLMDHWVQMNFTGFTYDDNAIIAKKGTIHDGLLHELKSHPFFSLPFPKTTGLELFNRTYLKNAISRTGKNKIPIYDVMATLNRFTAETIVQSVKKYILLSHKPIMYVSGGGMHNPMLMEFIEKEISPVKMVSTTQKGIEPDAKEAVLFAVLANETVAGQPGLFAKHLKAMPAVSMGKISFPT